MDQCTVCGAALREQDDWCGQCYAPRNTAHPAYHGPGAVDHSFADPRVAPPRQPVEVHYSRFRGGPTSMGVVGRTLTTIVAVLLAYMIYIYLFEVMLGETGPRELALYAVVAVPALLAVLRRVWRPHRIS